MWSIEVGLSQLKASEKIELIGLVKKLRLKSAQTGKTELIDRKKVRQLSGTIKFSNHLKTVLHTWSSKSVVHKNIFCLACFIQHAHTWKKYPNRFWLVAVRPFLPQNI